jgi:RND family efflux transporter MFP subunit
MPIRSSYRVVALSMIAAVVGLAGCNRAQTPASAAKAAAVVVSMPVKQRVTDYEDFTGRLEAPDTIDLRSRVTGYLDRANFIEGDEVKQGAVLFEIDARPYKAELDRAEANVVQAEVRFNRLETDLARAKKLVGTGAISQEDYDKVAGDRNEAAAAVLSAKASREMAKLNLSYTQVKAPIAGRVSRRYVDPGNLIKADDTILTSMVSQDPMHAYFDVDERTVLKLRRLQLDHKLALIKDTGVPVQLSLADEQDFTHHGLIDFADNRVDAGTGTRRLRGVFANPERLLAPGMFIRVRLPIGPEHSSLLVAEQALGSDQGRKYVYVINDKEEVEYRAVTLGALHDGLRVVEKGLTPDDRVIVTGLQRVRTGTKVEATLKDMPNPVTAAKVAITPATAAKAAP